MAADAVVLIVIIWWLLGAWALIDVGRRPAGPFRPVVGISKGAIVALVILTGALGGAIYLFRWRQPLINAEIGGRIPKSRRDRRRRTATRRNGGCTTDPWA